MQISVDLESCSAHGECVAAAPEIFALSDEDDVVRVLGAEPDESLRESAEAAAEACPMFAITVS